ncbi:MAG TPA: hypothetical protein PKW28_12475 [Turneriella sp.]|nr:hypothetical protein [Turneriella sp.]HNJ66704.1 hypothetical protein [Turneriella sp.]HNL54297.1 hypothetical protein [Turneriella sp.]
MDQNETQKRTLGQRAFDNIWFLLIIGMAFPGIFYLGWGMLEIFVFNNTQLKDYLAQSNQQYLLPGK